MADQTVAPKERVNITYKPATGDQQAEVELPLKMLFVGDYTGRPDDTPLEERKPVDINKENFDKVLAEHNVALTVAVPNKLPGGEGTNLGVSLEFKSMRDFRPDAIVEKVPELQKLLELRKALTALKSPLGNIPAVKKKIEALIGDSSKREQLFRELGIKTEEG
jgi:type VI secretion system protein ImpB